MVHLSGVQAGSEGDAWVGWGWYTCCLHITVDNKSRLVLCTRCASVCYVRNLPSPLDLGFNGYEIVAWPVESLLIFEALPIVRAAGMLEINFQPLWAIVKTPICPGEAPRLPSGIYLIM